MARKPRPVSQGGEPPFEAQVVPFARDFRQSIVSASAVGRSIRARDVVLLLPLIAPLVATILLGLLGWFVAWLAIVATLVSAIVCGDLARGLWRRGGTAVPHA